PCGRLPEARHRRPGRHRGCAPGGKVQGGHPVATDRVSAQGRNVSKGGRLMPYDNAQIIRGGYEAFAQGDVPAVLGMLSQKITCHVPGRSPLSGDYKGHDEVVGFLSKSMELSGGTMKVEVDEILVDGDRVVVLSTVSAQRNGTPWSAPEV